MFKRIKTFFGYTATNKAISKEAKYRLYEKVSQDIAEVGRDEGVWAVAFSQSEGNNQKAEALYIELMVQKHKDEMEASREILEKPNNEFEEDKKREEAERTNAKWDEAVREDKNSYEAEKREKEIKKKDKNIKKKKSRAHHLHLRN